MTSKMRNAKINVTIFRVVQTISFVLGLAPCKIDIAISSPKDIRYITKFSYSKSGCVYNISLAIIFSAITIVILPYISKDYDLPYSELVVALDITMSIIGNVFVVISAVNYCIYQEDMVKIGNQLSEIWFKLPSGVDKKSRIFYYVYVITSFVVVWMIPSVSHFARLKVFHFISFILSAIFLSGVLMQYSLIINVLKDNFQCLNQSFYKIAELPVDFQNNSPFSRTITKTQLIMNNFIRLRETRHGLYKMTCQICQFYSFPILLIIFHCCGNCVNVLYFTIVNYMHRERTCSNLISPTYCVLDDLSLMGLYAYPVMVLADTVKRFNTEMNRTADIIYDLKQVNTSNEEVVAELNGFAIELIHKKVEFTAFGFFTLDCTLLHSSFSMTVTYLMILLQFKPPDDATK